jgi:predicted nucleotidyltransferase
MNKFLLKENFSSINLYNKLALLTECETSKIYLGIEWIIENYPEAVIIGGTAVVNFLDGGRDLTPDLDIMVDSIDVVKQRLDKDNTQYKIISVGGGNLGITVDKFNADFLDSNAGNIYLNKLVLKTFKTTIIGGKKLRVITPELLTILKIELGRDKDIDDGLALIASKKLNKEIYLQFVNDFENKLHEYQALISYTKII